MDQGGGTGPSPDLRDTASESFPATTEDARGARRVLDPPYPTPSRDQTLRPQRLQRLAPSSSRCWPAWHGALVKKSSRSAGWALGRRQDRPSGGSRGDRPMACPSPASPAGSSGRRCAATASATRCCPSASRCRSSARTRSRRSPTRRSRSSSSSASAGSALLHLTPWLGAAVVVLLVVVVASYRQTCFAYPNGGGAYAVSRDNLGEDASLVAASALLIDYVLTVAVSVVAGVAAMTSAVPGAGRPRGRALARLRSSLLTVVNLRGVKESGPRVRGPHLRLRGRRATLLARRRPRQGRVRRRPHGRERRVRRAARDATPAGLADRLPGAARIRLGLHRADRRGGGVQRRAGVRGAQEPQRGDDPGDHGRRSRSRCSPDHRAGRPRRRPHGRGPVAALVGRRPATSSGPR